MVVAVAVGRSSSNKRCVAAPAGVYCPPDSGDRYKRVNRDHWHAKDSFAVTHEGGQICAKRLDASHGWGMNLKLGCGKGTAPPTPAPTPAPPMSASGKCSFESGLSGDCGAWYNAGGDKFDWSVRSGRTPSGSTGPNRAADGS
eukprot:11905228-Alexandrium_andersonii.AAC.1